MEIQLEHIIYYGKLKHKTMTTISQNKFDGGHAQDIRTTQTNECEESLNFDLYTNPFKLIPIYDNVLMNDDNAVEFSDVNVCTVAGNTYLVCLAQESSISTKPTFYITTNGVNGGWDKQAVGTNEIKKGTLEVYLQQAFCIGVNGTSYNLQRYNSANSVTNIGSITATASLNIPKPFVHPSDNKLYIAVGNYIGRWDNSSFIHSQGGGISLALPSNYQISSLCDWGDYLAIGTKPTNGIGNSYVYLWDRDIGLVDANQKIDFGEADLNIIENIGNTLIGIMYPRNITSVTGGITSTILTNKIDIKEWTGGAVEIIKSITTGDSNNINILKAKKDNKLYFAKGYHETAIWCFYKNKSGYWTITKERYIGNGVITTNQINSINIVGDYFYISSVNDSGVTPKIQMATSLNKTFLRTSIYKTTINPSMPIGDRYQAKQLQAAQVSFIGKANGNIALKYSVDGSTWTYIINEATTAKIDSREATMEFTGIPLLSGNEFQFQIESTGGVEVTELKYRYDKLNSTI